MPSAGRTPSHATAWASSPESNDVAAATTPARVAGATRGATTRLAGTETTETDPWSSTITGPHAAWAASGTAIAKATGRGSHRARASPHGRANSSRPRVARAESANP